MEPAHSLTNDRAQDLLAIKKIFKRDPGKPYLLCNLDKSGKEVIPLVSEDGLDEFSLEINRSKKILSKITFHHLEKSFKQCLFRLDINGPHHTNPMECNEHVPEEFKRFKGKDVGRSHIHFYVEGYGQELSWALPLKETSFSNFNDLRNIESILQGIINKVCEEINLAERLIYNQHISYE